MATAEKETIPLDIARMTKIQKLACLLVILGPESAAGVMKEMEDAEIETVCAEMVKIPMLPQEVQSAVLREFTGVAVEASTSVLGGVDFARNSLEKCVGLYKATDIIGRVAPVRPPVGAMQVIADMEPRQLVNLIKNEQPQTIALIISYLKPDKVGGVISQLRGEQRDAVLERMATLAPTPVEVVESVVAVLNRRLGNRQVKAMNQTGGVKTTADVLNSMDKNLSKSLLVSLEERNPELGAAIRQKMFTFEDLSLLDTAALQKILREVEMRDLAVALKTSSDVLKTALLSCLSKRAAETVNEEIGFMGPLKLRDIEAAQTRIIEVVRRLEGDGEIDLGGGGGEAVA
jgi:flagellar motor switch protein FliG